MTDRPILFSAAMVRAQLEGRKTQTRRIIKDAPEGGWICYQEASGARRWIGPNGYPSMPCVVRFAKGDRLWVREAWRAQEAFDKLSPVEIGATFAAEHGAPWCPVFYEASRRCDGSSVEMWQQSPPGRLRAAMHMPRWASRITWTVTDVRVQRLQEISEQDCIAEGPHAIDWRPGHGGWMVPDERQPHVGAAPRTWYRCLWDRINGAGAWDSNPWVVAITGTVDQRNIDA